MDTPDHLWYLLKCHISDAWQYMQSRSQGEWTSDSQVPHGCEIDSAYVSSVLAKMDCSFDNLVLHVKGSDSHLYMVTVQSWLCDIVEHGRLVVTDMEISTRFFGPSYASLPIGGTYYGPASGAAVIEAGRLLAEVAHRMSNEEEYEDLLNSLQILKNNFDEEYHQPLVYHLEMNVMTPFLAHWLDNETTQNLRLDEVERKAREILGNEEGGLDRNKGRVVWLTAFGIALSKRKIMGDVDNLIESLRDATLHSYIGTVDAGGRLNSMYHRYVISRMVLCRDGRVLYVTAEGLVFSLEERISKHGLEHLRLKRTSLRYPQVQQERWVRYSVLNRPCNVQKISIEVMGRLGMWLSERGVNNDAAGLSQILSKNMSTVEIRNWLLGIFLNDLHWLGLVYNCFRMAIVERGRRSGEGPKKILRRLAWRILYCLNHSKIEVTDKSGRPIIGVLGRRLKSSNGSPRHSEMSIVWRGQNSVSSSTSVEERGVVLANAAAVLTKQNAASRAGFLVSLEGYRKHVYSYMSAGNVQ